MAGLLGLLAGAASTTMIAMAAAKKKLARQFLNHAGQKPPGYTHVVSSPPGKMIFVSGQGGTGDDGNMPADFGTQAHNTFRHLDRCLKLAGASFADIVKVNYYLTDISKLTELRQIRSQYLNMEAPPASTAVQAGLSGGMLLEVECVAMIPE
jgi:enamine deaminase RidA (YjgF/YER057c/UK114 family)